MQFEELNIDNIAKEEVETNYCFSNMHRLRDQFRFLYA